MEFKNSKPIFQIHTGAKPYNCQLCEKNFNQSSGLRAHIKSHTGERNYMCVLCDRGFTQSSSLVRHMKLHKNYVPPGTRLTDNQRLDEEDILKFENVTMKKRIILFDFDNKILL